MAPAPRISLLIVEDEALIAENLRLTLEDLGYEVLATCYTYAEALAAFGQYAPDLVLLDINLGAAAPGHDGLGLAQHLSRLPAAPPFLFLTAYSDLDTIRQATRLAPSGYLIKPVNGAALFAAIQTAIERRQLHQPAPPPTGEATPLPDFFFVKLGGENHKVRWTDVVAMEAGKNYVTLRLNHDYRAYPLRGSLAAVLDQLVPEPLRLQFVRVSRQVALNLDYITAFDDEAIVCGGERYETSAAALRQLQQLRPGLRGK